MFHQIKKGITNIVKWFPIIWQDRDWDYHYIYIILHHKLKNMENYYQSDKCWSVNANKKAQEIRLTRLLLERLISNNYLENAMYWHDKKFDTIDITDMFKDNIYIGDQDQDRSKSFTSCCKHSDYMEEQDMDYLFSYMHKNINKWWD